MKNGSNWQTMGPVHSIFHVNVEVSISVPLQKKTSRQGIEKEKLSIHVKLIGL